MFSKQLSETVSRASLNKTDCSTQTDNEQDPRISQILFIVELPSEMNSYYFTVDDEDEEMIIAFCLHIVNISTLIFRKKHAGSTAGKTANNDRNYAAKHLHYMKTYFGLLRCRDL